MRAENWSGSLKGRARGIGMVGFFLLFINIREK